jgi:dinuclear metal center YbgI/SA1388 family protein
MNSEVKKALLTLDVTDIIVDYAIKQNFDLIISHHPIMLQAIKNITQNKLLKLIENKISVISAHTNLDISKHGVNDTLARLLNLKNILPLSMAQDIKQYQISIYTPENAIDKVTSAMHEAGAGIIGNYSHCATYFDTYGQYKPLENSNPFQGQHGTLEKVQERKIELLCEEYNLHDVINAMIKAHPYETPVYTIVELKQKSPNFGLGCYGDLESEVSLRNFSHFVKDKLNAPFVKLWTADKDEDFLVKRIAVCGGSGSSIIREAKQVADVYVSADFTYHQLLDAPMPVIDAGHFYTENPVMKELHKLFQGFECEIVLVPQNECDINNLRIIVQ